MHSSDNIRRSFLPANSPLLGSLAKRLLALKDNLKDCMVVVPTAHSGRQLRQALPTIAGKAILAPSVVTPEVLFSSQKTENPAGKIEWWSAWSETLRAFSDEELCAIFPNLEDVERDFSWGLKAARRFCKIKEEISTVDCSFSDLSTHCEEASLLEEAARWQQLSEIDKSVNTLLASRQLICPAEAKRQSARTWSPPAGVKQIIVACVPDLPYLARLALSQSSVPVELLIHAEPEQAAHFSDWGVPDTDYWTQCHLPLPAKSEKDAIVIRESGHALCDTLLSDCAQLSSDQIALSVTDSSFTAMVTDRFTEAGWPPFNPEGRAVSKSGLWAFLRQLRIALVTPHNFQAIPSLLKSPEVRSLLPSIPSLAAVSTAVDKLVQNHLPQNLGHAIRCAGPQLKAALEELETLLQSSRVLPAPRFIEQLFDKLECSADFPNELIEPFLQSIDALHTLEDHGEVMDAHQALDITMAACEVARVQADRTGTAIDQLGWLELSYSHEPHLKIVGMHESCVPERPHDDGFLPESLRNKIQLYSRAQLEARDSFLLHSILTARSSSQFSRIYLSQTTPTGEERQASRLLMRCSAELLPTRVQHCFQENIAGKKSLPPYSSGNWTLQLPAAPAWPTDKPLIISPSQLRNFLHCPMRYYLQRIEGFNRESIDNQELNAAQFGNVVHDVLEAFGRDPEMRDLTDATEIQAAFTSLLNSQFDQRYGETNTLPLSIQRESAQRRLEAFAAEQASLRSNGWAIHAVELAIGPDENEIPWKFADTPVRMRVDRIDIHEATGQYRVIDYKTSKKAKYPEDEHLTNVQESDLEHHVYGTLMPKKSNRSHAERRWQNLQLPLYAEFVKEHYQLSELPEVAYVSFPSAVSDTGLKNWANYDEESHACAMEWTKNILADIRTGNFPIRQAADAVSWDPFAALNPEGLDHAFTF